jgi:copper chaperone
MLWLINNGSKKLFQLRNIMNHIFTVNGMTCGHCEKAVLRAVQRIDPQALVSIERSQGKVQVESAQQREVLAKAIADEGYAVDASCN